MQGDKGTTKEREGGGCLNGQDADNQTMAKVKEGLNLYSGIADNKNSRMREKTALARQGRATWLLHRGPHCSSLSEMVGSAIQALLRWCFM